MIGFIVSPVSVVCEKMSSFLFEGIADIVLFIFDNLQREFPKFFTFRARDKVGVLIQTYMSNQHGLIFRHFEFQMSLLYLLMEYIVCLI